MALFHAYRTCDFSGKQYLEHIYMETCRSYPVAQETAISDAIRRHNGVVETGSRLFDAAAKYNVLPHGHYSFYAGRVPPSEVVHLADYRRTTRSTRAEWLKARRSGSIKISPMRALEATAVLNPGADIPHKGTTNQTTVKTGYYEGDYGFGAIPCYQPQNRMVVSHFAGLPLQHLPYDIRSNSKPHVFANVRAHYVSFDVEELRLPSAAVARKLWSAILADISSKPRSQTLITSAVAEANSGVYDLLTELGELRSTLSYIFGIFAEILRFAANAKKAVFKARQRPGATAASIVDEITSIWMQFRYAVSPLVYSANDLLELRTGLFGSFQTFRRGESSTRTVAIDGWSPINYEVVDRVFCKYRYDVKDGRHGLKLNLLSTAWELTPLSFVVDWVFNVGDYLSALVLPPNVQQTAYQYSRQLRATTLSSEKVNSTQTIDLNVRYYDATPFNPTKYLSVGIDVSMTWKRWIDAFALSWSKTKSAYRS